MKPVHNKLRNECIKNFAFFCSSSFFFETGIDMQVSGKMRFQVKDAEGDYGAFTETLSFGYKQYIFVRR